MRKALLILLLVATAIGVGPAPSIAQVRTIDPNEAIDSDLQRGQTPPPSARAGHRRASRQPAGL